jgi:hypothetical protein
MSVFAVILAAALPNRVAPYGLGPQSGECFTNLHDGTRVVDGTKEYSHFSFDRDYALEGFNFYDGGGMGIYRRYGAQWCVITRGGGALGETDLPQLGIPAAVAHRLFEWRHAKADAHR